MNPPRRKASILGKYGPAPAQGRLPLGSDAAICTNKLEKRLLEDPELLKRISDAAVELGGAERSGN
jgi:hypothetical protein